MAAIHGMVMLAVIFVLMSAVTGQQYGYKQGSIAAGPTDVMSTVFDRDNVTCLQFLGGAGGAAPWYTHVTFSSQPTTWMNVSILGHNLSCGKSLFVGLLPQNISMINQGTQNSRKAMCKVTSSTMENVMETCTLRCSCPGTSCNRLDIIHRPMSQPSDWQLCEIFQECSPPCLNGGRCADLSGTCACPDHWSGSYCEICTAAYLINTGSTTFCAPVEEDWVILFRRVDGSQDFNKTWAEYKEGFGDLTKEFWIGNENIHQLTTNGSTYRLRIDMTLSDGTELYAEYSQFVIASEADKYRITLSGYSGDAGDKFNEPNNVQNNMYFTTVDMDNDHYVDNCAVLYVGGWWYYNCFINKLTGLYGSGQANDGIRWEPYHDLIFAEFKVQIL